MAKKGTTVLFSSHILSDVQDVADRIGIISHGKIKQVGTLNELKNRLVSQKTVQVLLSFVSDKWQQFGAIKNVKSVEQPTPGRIIVHLESEADDDQVVNDIVQSIVKLGLHVRGISLLEPSLDEIYLNYVSEAEN